MLKKTYLFQLLFFEIYAIIKKVYCFNWSIWASTGTSHWEVFLEINLNWKTLKFYISCVYWNADAMQIDCKKAYSVLWCKHEHQNSALTYCSNYLQHGIGIFLYFLKDIENQRFPDVFWGYWKRPVS